MWRGEGGEGQKEKKKAQKKKTQAQFTLRRLTVGVAFLFIFVPFFFFCLAGRQNKHVSHLKTASHLDSLRRRILILYLKAFPEKSP